MFRFAVRLAICAFTALGAVAGAAAPVAGSDAALAELVAAREAAQRGQLRALEAWGQRHPRHPLEAYPAFWMLSGQLQRADPAEVRAFLKRYPDTPLAETLRREWLKSLAASGSWEVFRGELPNLVADDMEIACHSLHERLGRGDADASAEALALFRSGREAPAPCDPVFAALADAKRLTTEEIWDRVRRLLAGNQVREAKRVNTLLPHGHAFDDKSLDRAAADPSHYLARDKNSLVARSRKELTLFALGRLSRSKPEEAADRLVLLAPRLGSNASEYAWGQLAWQAATAHHPRALSFYAMARDAQLSDIQVAWKARAALRSGDWKVVLAAIQALSPEEARDPTWRYWRARALRQLGETEASTALLKGLAGETHFYGLLAAEEVNASVPPSWNGARPAAAELERMRSVPGIQRALALYRVNLDNEALREWIWALRGRDDRDLLAAAEVARLANEPDRAINTADRTVHLHDFTQRYPIPHREALAASAKHWALDEAIVFSIIRQESRFMPEARSRVGATGLMQLMPATASWVAKQIPVQPYSPDMLVQPEVNIHMGAYYFRRVLDELGHPILATAAYNAGPGRARRWRDARALEGAIYAETIPFNETRDYVKKVFANAWYYRHRLNGQAASMKQLLGMVPGRGAEPAATSIASNIP